VARFARFGTEVGGALGGCVLEVWVLASLVFGTEALWLRVLEVWVLASLVFGTEVLRALRLRVLEVWELASLVYCNIKRVGY
jgi:hypothetical protein